MNANKIGHVHLNVRNLENAERFYTEVFGFRVTERIRDTFVFLSLGDHHHDLALRNVGANAPIPPDLSVGMYHFAIEVENRKSWPRYARSFRRWAFPWEVQTMASPMRCIFAIRKETRWKPMSTCETETMSKPTAHRNRLI